MSDKLGKMYRGVGDIRSNSDSIYMYYLCEKCQGLLDEKRDLMKHRRWCKGDAKKSNCSLFACTNKDYLQILTLLANKDKSLISQNDEDRHIKEDDIVQMKEEFLERVKEESNHKELTMSKRARQISQDGEITPLKISKTKAALKKTAAFATQNTNDDPISDEKNVSLQRSDIVEDLQNADDYLTFDLEDNSINITDDQSLIDSLKCDELLDMQGEIFKIKNQNDQPSHFANTISDSLDHNSCDDLYATSANSIKIEGVVECTESKVIMVMPDNLSEDDTAYSPANKIIKYKRKSKKRENKIKVEGKINDYKIQKKIKADTYSKYYVSLPNGSENTAKSYYRCPHCDFSTKHVGFFERHLEKCTAQDGVWNCSYCEKCFKDQMRYRSHILHHKKRFLCDICSSRFADSRDLKQHMAKHTGDSMKCPDCDFTTRYTKSLREHSRKHSGELLRCDKEECSFSTAYSWALATHKAARHGNTKRFMCAECPYLTSYKTTFDKHCLLHSEEGKRFSCSQPGCSYRGFTQPDVNRHMARHSREKMFQCDQCSFSTKYSQALKKHLMQHYGVKPWQCSECKYTSIMRAKINRHISIKHPTADAKAVFLGFKLEVIPGYYKKVKNSPEETLELPLHGDDVVLEPVSLADTVHVTTEDEMLVHHVVLVEEVEEAMETSHQLLEDQVVEKVVVVEQVDLETNLQTQEISSKLTDQEQILVIHSSPSH